MIKFLFQEQPILNTPHYCIYHSLRKYLPLVECLYSLSGGIVVEVFGLFSKENSCPILVELSVST